MSISLRQELNHCDVRVYKYFVILSSNSENIYRMQKLNINVEISANGRNMTKER
jgi:hypothetical protein